jgi:hypothetical protein
MRTFLPPCPSGHKSAIYFCSSAAERGFGNERTPSDIRSIKNGLRSSMHVAESITPTTVTRFIQVYSPAPFCP